VKSTAIDSGTPVDRTRRPGPDGLVDFVHAFDDAVEARWEKLRGRPAMDRIFYTASAVGDFSLVWHTIGLSRAISRRDAREAIRFSTVMAAESAIVNWGIKSIFGRVRPTQDDQRPHHLRKAVTSSFPSGHASSAFTAATVLSDRSWHTPVVWTIACVVATSRIHVRIHHSSDVAAGAVVGLGLGLVARQLLRRLP
jgi:undecaprenyl-diphosphatase